MVTLINTISYSTYIACGISPFVDTILGKMHTETKEKERNRKNETIVQI